MFLVRRKVVKVEQFDLETLRPTHRSLTIELSSQLNLN